MWGNQVVSTHPTIIVLNCGEVCVSIPMIDGAGFCGLSAPRSQYSWQYCFHSNLTDSRMLINHEAQSTTWPRCCRVRCTSVSRPDICMTSADKPPIFYYGFYLSTRHGQVYVTDGELRPFCLLYCCYRVKRQYRTDPLMLPEHFVSAGVDELRRSDSISIE